MVCDVHEVREENVHEEDVSEEDVREVCKVVHKTLKSRSRSQLYH